MNYDLFELIRDDAIRNEPAFSLSPLPVIQAGRRHLRAHRISMTLRVAAVGAVLFCVAGAPGPAEGQAPDHRSVADTALIGAVPASVTSDNPPGR